jgi:hypothetical protein
LLAIISHGKIVVQCGSGRVAPDGTLNSMGAVNGVTQTALGRLTATQAKKLTVAAGAGRRSSNSADQRHVAIRRKKAHLLSA